MRRRSLLLCYQKKSFLYNGGTPWVKKGEHNFDISMGAWDGAESCDIVGLFLLDQIQSRVKGFDNGIYRDDALGVVETTPRNAEKIRQKLVSILKDFGFKITSKANIKVVEFLDVVLDLENEKYCPFIKPGDRPKYVNANSNHPPGILKNIPLAVNKRLSAISSSKEVFDQAAPLYQAELDRAGYQHKLVFEEVQVNQKRKRHKKIIWFNPPYSKNLKTNVGKKFLALLDKHFPRGSLLYPVLNRYKVKLSYRCLPNMASIISKHNNKILREQVPDSKCNCLPKDKAACPLPGKCATESVVYRATVSTPSSEETYVGLTGGTFKKRYNKHMSDFRHPKSRNATRLSEYIWKLKDEGTVFDIKWDIVKRAQEYSPVSRKCSLCIEEKFEILFNPSTATLNSRHELFTSCRHKKKKLLDK